MIKDIPGYHILTLSLNGSADFVGPDEDYLRSFRTRFCEQNGIIIDLGRNQEYANSMGVLYIVYPFPKFSFSSNCFRYSLLAMESSRCAHGERNLVTTRVGNEQSEPSDEHDLMSRAERDVFLLVAHE
jgi:hypothetical protein